MKKRFLALLLAVCIGVSVLVLPASATGSNTAVQTAVTLGAFSTEEAAGLSTPLTRGQLAKLLVAFSAYHDNANTQGSIGTLYTDVNGSSAYAPYIRIAVQQGWMSGYTDGSFRPDNTVTLEEACTAALTLLGYDITTLTGGFPAAQLNKANAIGLRSNLGCTQGQTMTLEEGAVLLYNALTANTADGSVYGTTLGYTVTNGQVDVSSILLSSLEGPFVASEGESLPFVPEAIYRNGSVSTSAQLSAYDVYYYNASAKTVWIYTRKAAGRITAVSPSASAPTSVTVAGTSYTIASSSAAAQLSSLNGGGVGQVVTLLLGMNNEAVAVLTGDEADEVFYGVVQTAARNLVEENGADVRQAVAVKCTDGVTRTVNVDKSLNYPAGWMVKITVNAEGEQVETITKTSTSGTINADSTALGGRFCIGLCLTGSSVRRSFALCNGRSGSLVRRGAIGRAAALGGICRGADGLHGDDAGQVGQCIQGQLTADELGKFGIRDGDHLPRAAFGFQDGLIQRSRAGLDVIAHRHEPEADHGSQDRAHSQKHELKNLFLLHIRYFLISPGSP